MARRRNLDLTNDDVAAIEGAMRSRGLNRTQLAELLERDGAAVSRMLHKTAPNASAEVLRVVERIFGLRFPHLLPQGELWEIDPDFLRDAKRELERLRIDAGDVEAVHVTGFVGLQFHGPTPERSAIERRFLVKLVRKKSSVGEAAT